MQTQTPGTLTSTPALLEGLTTVGLHGFFDVRLGVVVAYPAGVTPAAAFLGEHVTIAARETTVGTFLLATAWVPDGGTEFLETAEVYTTPLGRTLAEEVVQCTTAIAQYLAEERQTAGHVLRAALAEYGITPDPDGFGMSFAIPLDPSTPVQEIRNRDHLVVGDYNPSIEHVPAAHTGWSVFRHDANGETVGDPLYISEGGELVDCAADSRAVAATIANYLTKQTRRPSIEAAVTAAEKAGPTEGDKLRAALAVYGISSFPFPVNEGGVSYVLVAVDRTSHEGDAVTGPHLAIASGEAVERPAADHDKPWNANVYAGDGTRLAHAFTAPTGLTVDEESAVTAWALVRWLDANAARFPRH